MAVSWTALAGRYRHLKNNGLLPSAIFCSHTNAKLTFDKHCHTKFWAFDCLQDEQAVNLQSVRGSYKYHNYYRGIGTTNSYSNSKRLLKYDIVGCQKHLNGFPSVNCKTYLHTSSKYESTRLTPAEATNILRANEYTTDELWAGSGTGHSPVKSFDMNSIRSNNPTEDAHSEAIIRVGTTAPNSMLFGIFDGHGGAACGQVNS